MSHTDRFKKSLSAGLPDHWVPPVASGTVIEVSDLLMMSSGKARVMSATTNNLVFVGPALAGHAATDPSGTIMVGKPNGIDVYEYDLNAATDITFGDLLQWNAAQKLAKSATDAIACAVESKLQATKIRCVFMIPATTGALRAVGDAS